MPYLSIRFYKPAPSDTLIEKQSFIKYRQLDTLSYRLAWVLIDAGIEKGDNATHRCRDRAKHCAGGDRLSLP